MRASNVRNQYYLEGESEKKLVKTLIEQRLILPGQTDVLNPVQDKIKTTHIRRLPSKTNVILIFDTDRTDTQILEQNIQFLTSQPNIGKIITITQVNNLEDELKRCTDIRYIRELVNCAHNSDFKTMFINERRLFEKMQSRNFDIGKLWVTKPNEMFIKKGIVNNGEMIKI